MHAAFVPIKSEDKVIKETLIVDQIKRVKIAMSRRERVSLSNRQGGGGGESSAQSSPRGSMRSASAASFRHKSMTFLLDLDTFLTTLILCKNTLCMPYQHNLLIHLYQ